MISVEYLLKTWEKLMKKFSVIGVKLDMKHLIFKKWLIMKQFIYIKVSTISVMFIVFYFIDFKFQTLWFSRRAYICWRWSQFRAPYQLLCAPRIPYVKKANSFAAHKSLRSSLIIPCSGFMFFILHTTLNYLIFEKSPNNQIFLHQKERSN